MRPIAALALGCALLSGPIAARADGLRVGAAAVDITPPPGTPMAGYYHTRAADGVSDPLFAKALVIESGGTKVALVSLDLIATSRSLVESSREAIEAATDLDGEAVMISATHAHTGPVITGRGQRDDAFGGGTDLAKAYNAALPQKIAEAVKLAEAALAPAVAKAGVIQEPSIAFNRRFHMRDGTVGWNPGIMNPNILKPAGPIDPDLAIVDFEAPAADGRPPRPRAAYLNYPVHLDNVGGTHISADMPAVIAQLLGAVQGPDFVTVYTSGCCGDINHINVKWAAPQKGLAQAGRMGVILAAAALRAWPDLQAVPDGPLRYASRMVELPLAEYDPAEVEGARAIVAAAGKPGAEAPKFMDQVQAFKVLDVVDREGKPLEVEVQAIALGDRLAWVSLPGEIFVELGLELKRDSPFPQTMIAELANGSIGYIPSRRAYPQGNYEVVSARCAAGSGEKLVEAAVAMLKELHAKSRESGTR